MKKGNSRTGPFSARKKGIWILAGLAAGLLIITWVFAALDIDRSIAGRFYSPAQGWPLGDLQPWRFLHQYGTIPGIILTVAALVAWFGALVRPGMAAWRRPLMVIVLTSIIGGGFIINGMVKPYWGRPRPRQVQEFGGLWQYRGIFPPGQVGKGESFPCGHCTMGFVFVPMIFLHRRSRSLAYGGAAFGLVYGSLISTARVLQGAHYASDCIWSLGILMMTAAALHYLILRVPEAESPRVALMSSSRRIFLGAGISAAVLVIALSFMTRRPFYETHEKVIASDPALSRLVVQADVDYEKTQVRYSPDEDELRVRLNAQGFGLPNVSYSLQTSVRREGDTVFLTFNVLPGGYYSELNHTIEVFLPQGEKDRLAVEFRRSEP